MVYIETNTDGYVIFEHRFPFHINYGMKKTEEELLQTGYLVTNIQEAPFVDGKKTVTKYINGEIIFEYLDIPLTEIEQLKLENQQLKQSQTEQDALIMQLLLGGA